MPAVRAGAQKKMHPCTAPNCTMSFPRKHDLNRHMTIHTGEKRFVCRLCGHACSQKSNLTTHENTHTGLQPYACDISGCNARFTDPSCVIRHRNEKHSGKTYKCSVPGCSSQGIKRRSEFVKHLNLNHAGLNMKRFDVNACRVWIPVVPPADVVQPPSRPKTTTLITLPSSQYLAPPPLTYSSSGSGSVSPLSMGPSSMTSVPVAPLFSSEPARTWETDPRYLGVPGLSPGSSSSGSVSPLAPPVPMQITFPEDMMDYPVMLSHHGTACGSGYQESHDGASRPWDMMGTPELRVPQSGWGDRAPPAWPVSTQYDDEMNFWERLQAIS